MLPVSLALSVALEVAVSVVSQSGSALRLGTTAPAHQIILIRGWGM